MPRKALQELQRLEGEGNARVSAAASTTSPSGLGRRELICRILEGTFPDYERVIAKDNDKKVLFDRKTLVDAVQRAALMTGDRARAVRLQFSPDQLVISAVNSDLGEAVEEVACDYDGPEFRVGINPDYLSQFLRGGGDREGPPGAQGREHPVRRLSARGAGHPVPLRDHADADLTTLPDLTRISPPARSPHRPRLPQPGAPRPGSRRPARISSWAATAPARPASSRRSTSLATTRSFRAAQIADCARHGAGSFHAQGEVETDRRAALEVG